MVRLGNVLLLDDSATIRTLLKIYLMDLVKSFRETPSAEAALAMLEQDEFGAVIADVRMEPVDGIAFVRRVRSSISRRVRSTPVVLLTSDLSETLRVEGLGAGANAFVHKPVSAKVLRDTLEGIIARVAI